MAYRVVEHENGVGRIAWEEGTIDLTAEEALAPADGKGERQEEAEEFLRGELAEGPAHFATLVEKAADLGISEKTLRRARRALKLVPDKEKKAGGRWLVALPDTAPEGLARSRDVAQAQAGGDRAEEVLS